MKCLIQKNTVIDTNKNIYIVGTDENAFRLYMGCCALHINICGFVGEYDERELSFFNKHIYTYEDLKNIYNDSEWQLLVTDSSKSFEGSVLCESAGVIAKKLKRRVAIYGAGNVGRILKDFLTREGYIVECFIVTGCSKNEMVDGISICSEESLQSLEPEVSIVVAGRFYEDIEKVLCDCGVDTDEVFYIANDALINDELKDILLDNCCEFTIARPMLIFIDAHWKNKTIILYGGSLKQMKAYRNFLHYMGYATEIACDYDEKDCIEITDVLYMNNYIIFLFDVRQKYRLNELGLKEVDDYVSAYFPTIAYLRTRIFDVNLGHALITSGARGKAICPGITRYGDNKDKDLIIIALGGSCTEDGRNTFPTWSEYLFQIMEKNGIYCTVYNCGMSGYTSAQELLRFIRDGVLLEPDIVISYSGVNEYSQKPDKRFDFQFVELKNAFDYMRGQSSSYNYTTGLESEICVDDKWLINEKMINAVATCFGCECYSFVQPNFLSKNSNKTVHERSLDLMLDAISGGVQYREKYVSFRKKAKKMADSYGFIYDFTGIFDDVDVFIDSCHVYENGNRIIAEKMWEVIQCNSTMVGSIRRDYT